jgi:hypothetical protein
MAQLKMNSTANIMSPKKKATRAMVSVSVIPPSFRRSWTGAFGFLGG